MNKKIIAGAILGIASGAAFAQSSVTIYGVVDAGLTATRGVVGNDDKKHTRVGLDNGLLSNSRIGFKGTEDLGNGTAAIFNLEAGFNVDDGTNAQGNGQLFGRRAIVGLTNANYGTIELGRQDSILDDTVSSFDAFGGAKAAQASNLIRYDDRINNSLTYTTANYAGFSAKANYAFGENAGSTNVGNFYGIALNYANDAFAASLAAAHSDYRQIYGEKAKTATTGDISDIYGGDARKRDQYILGASYDFQVVKAFGQLSYAKTNLNSDDDGKSKLKEKAAVIGVAAPFGASTVMASAGYVNYKPNGSKSANAQQYAIGYTYDFSKRTTFYAAYDYVRNNSQMKNGGEQYVPFATALGGTQTLGVGIRHKF